MLNSARTGPVNPPGHMAPTGQRVHMPWVVAFPLTRGRNQPPAHSLQRVPIKPSGQGKHMMCLESGSLPESQVTQLLPFASAIVPPKHGSHMPAEPAEPVAHGMHLSPRAFGA